MTYFVLSCTVCDENQYGENCEVPCNSQCKVHDGRDCDLRSGVCLGGCKHIDNPANINWSLGDRCDILIREFICNCGSESYGTKHVRQDISIFILSIFQH